MIRRAAAAIAILCTLAGAAAQLHAADGCVTLNRGSGCKSGAGTWTAGNCLCATDTSNAAFGAVTASGLTCTDCVDGSDLADAVTCDANPWVLDCGISISTQNTGATNRLTILPNASVDGGSACPAGGNLYVQDTDDGAGEGYEVCLPDSSSLTIDGGLIVDDSGYLQAKKYTDGAPAAGDCDAMAEFGRMVADPNAGIVYFCNGAGHNGTAGWGTLTLGF